MDKDPFGDLKISDASFLDDIPARTVCPKCGRTRKYYCYTCYVPMTGVRDKISKIKLPMKVDVIKHPSEVDGKSTAVHAAVMSDEVTIYTYPVIPDYEDPSRVILIFPGEKSVTLEELAETCPPAGLKQEDATEAGRGTSESESQISICGSAQVDDVCKRRHAGTDEDEEPAVKKRHVVAEVPFDRVVFIDSTWNQTMKIYKDERLKGLKQVELKTRTTRFWRYQRDKPNTYLATIEAIYYFFVDYHKLFIEGPHNGTYDDLLFFFSYMYSKIRTLNEGGKELMAYKQFDDKQKLKLKKL